MSDNTNVGAGKYAYLLLDAAFKVVICTPQNEQLVIEILELLIPGKKIASITFVNKEHHGLVVSEKNVNFDLLCKDGQTGEEFLVEVQNREQKSFRDRMLVYSTYPIREQMELRVQQIRDGHVKDPMDYSLRPVYVVSMVNFCLEHKSEAAVEHGYISRYELRNGHNGELMTPSLNFVFLELDRLKLGPSESDKCASLLERFVFSLKYMHTMTAKPAEFEDDLLNRLFQATELASMTVTTRQNYDKVMWTEIDQIATMNYATEKAMAKGEAKGKTDAIMSFIKAGATDEMVAKATGLSAEEIASMRKESQK